MNGRRTALPIALALAGLLISAGFGGCSHGRTRASGSGSASGEGENPKLESLAEKAVVRTSEDERMAPKIQKEINALFFRGKEKNPGGLDAFSADRIQELENEIAGSDRPTVRYYVENRAFFDRYEDLGGGFRVVPNAKRLVPYRWTRSGRKKLFSMDEGRVKEMIAHPCFTAIEDCGESSSDGEQNTPLLQEWTKKYPEQEFRPEIEKVLRGYVSVLERYRKRVLRGFPRKPKPGAKEPLRERRARQGADLIESHVRGIELLIKTD